MYRAKFRVLRRTESTRTRWEGQRNVREPIVVIDLSPVNTKNQWDPNGSEENAAFWEATPSGEAELVLSPEDATAYPVGQAFYIDFQRDAAGTWKRGMVTLFNGAVEVFLHPAEGTGKVKMNVQRVGTVLALLDDVVGPMRESIAELATKGVTNGYDSAEARWSVTFTATDG